jgi:hypothetical protein
MSNNYMLYIGLLLSVIAMRIHSKGEIFMSSHNSLKLKMLLNTLYASVACAATLVGSQAAVAGCATATTAAAPTTTTAITATPTTAAVSINNPQLAAPNVVTPVVDDKLAGGGGPKPEQTLTTVAR